MTVGAFFMLLRAHRISEAPCLAGFWCNGLNPPSSPIFPCLQGPLQLLPDCAFEWILNHQTFEFLDCG